MFYKWWTGRAKARFNRLTAGILTTPPMPVVEAPWTIISMVSKSDPQMYILAMKSFYRRLKRGKITAIVDRDMPEEKREILRHHLPGIKLVHLEDIDTGPCQRGGTWERILYVLDHSRDEYAIQIDADTLTFGPEDIQEVKSCVENNLSFTLGNAGRPIAPMLDIVEDARAMKSNYVGIVLEAAFDRYPGAANLKYVRASSGFCGYAKGGISRAAVEQFHIEGEKLLGARFREWGTEQSASNFAVANSPGAVVLPYPKYANFWSGLPRGKSTFLHFIGANRYLDDYFVQQAHGVIADLNAGR